MTFISIKALRRLLRLDSRDISQSQNRRLANTKNETSIAVTVFPAVKYNMDTMEVENL